MSVARSSDRPAETRSDRARPSAAAAWRRLRPKTLRIRIAAAAAAAIVVAVVVLGVAVVARLDDQLEGSLDRTL